MSGILAQLIIECEGGDPIQAGHVIDAYEQSRKLAKGTLRTLRIQVGGETALKEILHQSLKNNFEEPIRILNDDTHKMWQKTIRDAQIGFLVRIVMSVCVFVFGIGLLAVASHKMIFGTAPEQIGDKMFSTGAPFATGITMMLLTIYTGPLKDIRQSVNDMGTASAAFIAYVHRILEISHTFSYYYLRDKVSFEEIKTSNELIREAMLNTIEQLNRSVSRSKRSAPTSSAGKGGAVQKEATASSSGSVTQG